MMKSLLAFSALAIFATTMTSSTAHSNEVLYRYTCSVVDLELKPDPNVQVSEIELKANDQQPLITYKGYKLHLRSTDLTDPSQPLPRRQITLGSRAESDNKVVASAVYIFSVEAPEIGFQQGPYLIVNCYPKN
jgi:hypothetical protein